MSSAYLNDIADIWNMVRQSFYSKLSRETVDLWFGELTVVGFENNTITLSTSSELKLNIIKKRHLEDIKRGFSDLMGFDIDVDIVFNGKPVDPKNLINILEQGEGETKQNDGYIPPVPPITNHAADANFDFQYTFDNFIIGASNKFAHAACVAVADRPAMNYNPLFIYGQSGLGKTHLMYAIINQLKRNNPNINIIYVKGDDFTNQLVESLKSNAPSQFRERYRKCDVLLIDDIQFIAGREATQEEFFHTFNSLFEEHKQIILTSDRPPRDIKTLEDRLRTRFEWGLIADIQPPDLELRIAIIKKKAEQVNIHMPDDVLMFLAENLRSNIRQIEGAIKKLGALIFLSGKELNMDLARSCIIDISGGAEPVSVTVDKIFAAIFKKYGVKREDIVGSRRTKEVAFARHVSVYLIRAITDMSFPNIGKIMGRDHSTIMSSIDAIERKMQSDSMFSLEISELKKEITGQ
jgi:chromosomal replication initiator protein